MISPIYKVTRVANTKACKKQTKYSITWIKEKITYGPTKPIKNKDAVFNIANIEPPKIAIKTCPANKFAKIRIARLAHLSICEINSTTKINGTIKNGTDGGTKKPQKSLPQRRAIKKCKAMNEVILKKNGINKVAVIVSKNGINPAKFAINTNAK